MKQVLILGALALLLVSAWALFGPGFTPAPKFAPLVTPENPADAPALVRSAHQLWKAWPGHYDSAQVLALLKLLTERLDDASWRAVSAPAYHAWSQHRGIAALRPALIELNKAFLPKLLRAGTLSELEQLIRAAAVGGFEIKQIQQAMDDLIAQPLGPEGLPGSRAELLLVACLRANEPQRAKDYAAKLRPSDIPGPAAWILEAADLALKSQAGHFAIQPLIAAWHRLESEDLGRAQVRSVLEQLCVGEIADRAEKPGAPPALPLFEVSQKDVDALPYWTNVLQRSLWELHKKSDAFLIRFEALLKAYAGAYAQGAFAYEAWFKAGEAQFSSDQDNWLRPVAFYERALAVAPSPDLRLKALKKIAEGYQNSNEFSKARAVIEKLLPEFEKSPQLKELNALLAGVKKLEVADAARVEREKKLIDQDRRRGRLQNMKDQLIRARKEGREEAVVRALEKAVKDLEHDVTE